MSVSQLEQFRRSRSGQRIRRNLRYYRIKAGLTQEGLAHATHGEVTVSTISNIERTGKAHVETLDVLSEALGIDITKLLIDKLPKDGAQVLASARGLGKNHSSTQSTSKNKTRNARNVITLSDLRERKRRKAA